MVFYILNVIINYSMNTVFIRHGRFGDKKIALRNQRSVTPEVKFNEKMLFVLDKIEKTPRIIKKSSKHRKILNSYAEFANITLATKKFNNVNEHVVKIVYA